MTVFKLVIASHTLHEGGGHSEELYSTLWRAEDRWKEISEEVLKDNEYKDSLKVTVYLIEVDTQEQVDYTVLYEAYSQNYVDFIKTQGERYDRQGDTYFHDEYERVVVLPRIFPNPSDEVKQQVDKLDRKLGRRQRRGWNL